VVVSFSNTVLEVWLVCGEKNGCANIILCTRGTETNVESLKTDLLKYVLKYINVE